MDIATLIIKAVAKGLLDESGKLISEAANERSAYKSQKKKNKEGKLKKSSREAHLARLKTYKKPCTKLTRKELKNFNKAKAVFEGGAVCATCNIFFEEYSDLCDTCNCATKSPSPEVVAQLLEIKFPWIDSSTLTRRAFPKPPA